jgi:acetyl-CoA carboxylase biotin carboxylase subunit
MSATINKILVANRGEIALRVIRTCHEMDLKTVGVYSTIDRDSLHVRFASEAVCIGGPPSKESYLRPDRLIAAAEVTGADAIHPGYGFLAESAHFSAICEDHDIKFIGPRSETISVMGDKSYARRTMEAADVPTLPGSEDEVANPQEAAAIAAEIGYPVMLKASAGGGGRGMRIARDASELEKMFNAASSEAEAAFDSGALYVEKFVQQPRHVEIQVMGDGKGDVFHLGERDCTIQRRHQKLLEEAPSPIVDEDLRQEMGEAAIKAAKAVDYEGAGTVEFLVDQSGDFYFMEMNTRIQVEHPVTEEITDTDLIQMQILVAMDEPVPPTPFEMDGHAIECRINAEDPRRNFSPSPGDITAFHVPGGHGVRVDTHAYAGYRIPPHYDSMVAKLICRGKTREQAISKMRRALDEFVIEGIQTTIPFHRQLMDDPRFQAGEFDTGFLNDFSFSEEM